TRLRTSERVFKVPNYCPDVRIAGPREDRMSRRAGAMCAVMMVVMTGASFAQRAPQTRPPLFLGESWKALTTPPDDHGAWPASQAAVASANLQLTLHGTSSKEIVVVAVRGSADLYPLNLWTGTTTS